MAHARANRFLLLVVVVLAGAAGASGCGGGSKCTADSACTTAASPRCDPSSGQCVACLPANDNCGPGRHCAKLAGAYQCTATCTVDSECPGQAGQPGKVGCCNGTCLDLTGDAANCGACGKSCGSLANTTLGCINGACSVTGCGAGFLDCDLSVANGCEVDSTQDLRNCGGCGKACKLGSNDTVACAAGVCRISCMGGYADCDGDASNGCEVNTGTSLSDCGGCGMVCGPLANADAACVSGMCGIHDCTGTFGDCNKNPADGCELDTSRSTSNCGVCGNACPVTPGSKATCSAGLCGFTCNAGYADCNLDPGDGCEIRISSDTHNCGSCGRVCVVPHARAGCAKGACTVNLCNAGFGDCNGDPSDGCESNINVDINNCGACGNACMGGNVTCLNGACTCKPCDLPHANASCVMLSCVISSCLPGWTDCDGNPANGCEAATASDAKNCGACGVACGGMTPYCQGGVCGAAGSSCLDLLNKNPKLADGVYTVDPDGVGGIAPTQVLCDMTTAGGGWLVCYNHQIVNIEEMDQSTVTHMGSVFGVPGATEEFGTDCRGFGHAMKPATVRFTAAGGQHWVQINNAPDAIHEFFFAGNRAGGVTANITTWSSGKNSFNRLICVHDCPGFAYNTNNINQIANGTNSGNCFEHNSKGSDSNHHWAIWGNCDGTYVEGPNQGAGGANPDLPRDGWARVMLR